MKFSRFSAVFSTAVRRGVEHLILYHFLHYLSRWFFYFSKVFLKALELQKHFRQLIYTTTPAALCQVPFSSFFRNRCFFAAALLEGRSPSMSVDSKLSVLKQETHRTTEAVHPVILNLSHPYALEFRSVKKGQAAFGCGKRAASSSSDRVCSTTFTGKPSRSASGFPLRPRLLCAGTRTICISGSAVPIGEGLSSH